MRRRLVQAIARNRVATTSTTKVAIGSHSETIDQAIARNRVATTSTTKVAIGSHSETIEVGVYVGNAIAMLAPCPEY